MKFDETEKELLVDQAIDSVRSVRPPAERMNRSVQRVRERLSSAHASLLDCEDFQALMSDFLAGDLAETRRLLLEDHIGGCPRCRRRLQAIAAGPSERPVHSAPPVARRPWIQWSGIAAALLLSVFLLRTALVDGPAYLSAEAWSVVEDSQGPLFRLAGSDLIPLSPGERLEASTPIRTGSGSTALLKMADGTSIEISERAQLQIRRGWRGNQIHLERGAIIVEAAEQGRGRLSVNTTDVRVDVKGTVFSVSHGLKGSRVSVLAGEVQIREGAHEFSMKAGEQFASGRKLSAAPIAGEISWSRNADSHMELLGRLHEIGLELQLASFSDSLRYSSELIGLIPAPPVFVAAVPNLTSQLDEVMAELSGRMAHDPILAEWLAGRITDEHGNDIGALVERFQAVGERLGPEVVLAVVEGPASDFAPLLLTTTEDAAGLEEVIWAEVNRLATEHPEGLPIVVTRDLTGHSEAAEVWILLHGRLVTASTSRELLQQVAAIFDRQSVGSFAGSQFHQTLMEEYAQGIDWLISIDLESLQGKIDSPKADGSESPFAWLGVEKVSNLVLQRKRVGAEIESRAVLRYEGEGEGLATLLGTPGAMGGLEFVTPEAQLASAFVIENPFQAVDRLFLMLEKFHPEAWREMVDFQIRNGVNLRDDLAATLGGEFIFAVDGSLLPTPSWKLIVEVYDSGTFHQTMLRLVEELNRRLESGGAAGYTVQPVFGSPGQYVFRSADGTGPELVYGFDSGYLIAAPSSAVISRAVQAQRSGYTLASSAEFQKLLPRDTRTNLSALYYHQTGFLHDFLMAAGPGLKAESSPVIEAMKAGSGPSLFALYSEPNRLSLTGSGGQESLWMNLAAMAALSRGR